MQISKKHARAELLEEHPETATDPTFFDPAHARSKPETRSIA